MIDFFIYYMLSKQKFKKIQQKQLQIKNRDVGQFDPTGTNCTFFCWYTEGNRRLVDIVQFII